MKKYKVICPLIGILIPWNVLIGSSNLTSEEKLDLFKKRQKQVIEGIELSDGIKIRLILKEEIEDLKSSLFPSPKDILEFISKETYILEKELIVEKDHGFETDKLMRNIVLAFNLFKTGHVHGNDVFYFRESKNRHLTGWSRDVPLPPSEILRFGYGLNLEEIPKLKRFIKKIQKINFVNRKSLLLSCKRFQRMYSEYDFEDQLIECMIAFEALFLKGEKGGQSRGNTIAIACSVLLGRNNSEREEIKSTLNLAYSMRNKIVHGGECRKDINPFEFVEEIGEYLRQSIIKFLN